MGVVTAVTMLFDIFFQIIISATLDLVIYVAKVPFGQEI